MRSANDSVLGSDVWSNGGRECAWPSGLLLKSPTCARLRHGNELLRLTNRRKAVPHVDARFANSEPVLDALLTGLVNFVDTRAKNSLAIRDVLRSK